MKDLILNILMEKTYTEFRYVGGGDEPEIIVFKFSEDINRITFLSQVADEIVVALNKIQK